MNAGAGSAVHEDSNIAIALPCNGIHDVGITRIHVNFRHARVEVIHIGIAEAFTQYLAPVLAAVRGLEESAITAAGPQRSLGSDKNSVGVARVNANHADVL